MQSDAARVLARVRNLLDGQEPLGAGVRLNPTEGKTAFWYDHVFFEAKGDNGNARIAASPAGAICFFCPDRAYLRTLGKHIEQLKPQRLQREPQIVMVHKFPGIVLFSSRDLFLFSPEDVANLCLAAFQHWRKMFYPNKPPALPEDGEATPQL